MDNNLMWYRIPGYNGYEYNFENKVVRSIKNYKVNPYGRLIKKYKGRYYKMSNMQNEVKMVTITEIERLINEDPYKRPIPTYCTNMGSRNIVTRKKYANSTDPKDEVFFPDFDDFVIDKKD